MSPSTGAGSVLRRLVDVRREEVPALAWSWAYIFALLASYYMLRPIRDQMGIARGLDELPWLFMATLVGMLALNLPFAWLVKRLPRARFVPLTYRFFIANILVFAGLIYAVTGEAQVYVGYAFFVWLSVFNLFVVSIFWATVIDVFSTEQGKRLFGFIAAGATLGAIAGSAVTATLAQAAPTWALLIGAAILLELAVQAMRGLSGVADRLHELPDAARQGQVIGGGVLAGLRRTFASPYLLNIALFLALYSITSTFLYREQAGIARASFSDKGAQQAFFASVDLAVNVLTLGVQLFVTGRLTRAIGVGPVLALLPAASVLGFGWLAVAPSLTAIVTFQVLRRAGNFALARPVREVLFTVLPREDRYKTKAFIDTVVYRTGDQIGIWTYPAIAALGFGASAVSVLAVPLSLAWLVSALWLGREQAARQERAEASDRADAGV